MLKHLTKTMLTLVIASCLLISGAGYALDTAKASTNNKDAELKALFDKGWQMLGTMHKNKAVLDDIVKIYQKALTIDPNSATAYWKLAEVTFKKGVETPDEKAREQLFKDSANFSKKALELNSKCVEAHYWLGTSSAKLADMAGILNAIGLVNTAKKELKQAFEMDPNNRFSALAGSVLAIIYAESPWPLRKLDLAEDYALQAVKKDPNLTLASETLSKVYIKKEEYGKARAELKRCLSISSPTYVWDSELYDWPSARKLLKEIETK